jgi:hypothetical protein
MCKVMVNFYHFHCVKRMSWLELEGAHTYCQDHVLGSCWTSQLITTQQILQFFLYPSTLSAYPLIISFIYINHTHTCSQVIGHYHTCDITHYTHSCHSLYHHDIIHNSHSLSMTSSKIQTWPTSNSIINRDLISNHPLSLIKILIRSNLHQLWWLTFNMEAHQYPFSSFQPHFSILHF